ncbi:MAG: hypothetical protein DCC65_12165 [Planctomycetota bacterium]|nr:MAG: hypothetical protein DCC65_12165 [Planctomycetota bacterium]
MQSDTFEALPAPLMELVGRVVRTTRLWPSERRDVQAELESHFREGLIELTQEGLSLDESVEALRDGFGNPELAAKLIRRGKKRGRPMFWKFMIGTAVAGLTGVGAGAGYVAVAYFGKPSPTVDYVAKINEPVARTAEDDRAWPILRDVILQMKETAAAHEARNSLPLPGEATWPEAMAWLSENRGLLPLIAEASDKPVFGFVYNDVKTHEFMIARARARGLHDEAQRLEAAGVVEDPLAPPTVMILLPHLSDVRDMGRLLVLDARDRFYHGDFVGAWQSLDTVYRLGMQLVGGQTLIEQLVGRAMLALAGQDMRRMLFDVRDTITADQLAAVTASRALREPKRVLRADLDGEQLFFQDVVQYVFTDDGNGNGRLIPSQFDKVSWLGAEVPVEQSAEKLAREARTMSIAAVHADRRDTLAKYFELWTRMKELLALPLYDSRRAELPSLVDQAVQGELGGRKYALVGLLLPSLSNADQSMREADMELSALHALVAVLAYRLENGVYPAQLRDLSGGGLTREPVDAYSGMYLRFRMNSAGMPILYSVGRNLTDDGGSAEPVEVMPGGRASPRDIVYWPETLGR